MMDRKYSLSEIDSMRNSIEILCDNGSSYRAQDRTIQVEQRLRTYMENGTNPAELEQAASRHMGFLYEAQTRRAKAWRAE